MIQLIDTLNESLHVRPLLENVEDFFTIRIEIFPKDREKAFTLFFSSKGTGTGLGLFISDRIANAHGGSIKLESEPNSGCRFVVQLPREAPVDEESAEETDADNTLSTEKEVTHG